MVGGSGTRDSQSIQANTSSWSLSLSTRQDLFLIFASQIYFRGDRRNKEKESHSSFAPDQLWFRPYFLLQNKPLYCSNAMPATS